MQNVKGTAQTTIGRTVPTTGGLSKGLPYQYAHLYFSLAFVLTIAGFWPSFFQRLGDTDAAHLIHGVSATLWMMVPIIQAWLIGHRNVEWHRRLGRLSLLLVPVLVISGLHMVQIMLVKVFQNEPGLSQSLRFQFGLLDISAMAFFVVVLILALKSIYKRAIKTHAQYMSCTVLIVLEPGLERFLLFWVPGIDSFGVALNVTLFVLEAVVAVLILFEWRSDRIPVPYVMTLLFFIAVHLLLGPVSGSDAFYSFAQWFATI